MTRPSIIGSRSVTALALALAVWIAVPLRGDVATIRVEVKDKDSYRAVQNARVMIIATDGRELSTATTDGEGIASLAVPAAGAKPRYVLVEREQYFISGLTWQDGLREYYILMTVLAVK